MLSLAAEGSWLIQLSKFPGIQMPMRLRLKAVPNTIPRLRAKAIKLFIVAKDACGTWLIRRL